MEEWGGISSPALNIYPGTVPIKSRQLRVSSTTCCTFPFSKVKVLIPPFKPTFPPNLCFTSSNLTPPRGSKGSRESTPVAAIISRMGLELPQICKQAFNPIS